MKKLIVISSSFLIFSGFAYAGGDILPPVFETEEVIIPFEPYVEPTSEVIPVPESTPEVIPSPEPVFTPIPKPKPVPVSVPVRPTPIAVVNDILPLGLYVAAGLTAARYDPKCNCITAKGKVDKTAGLIGRVGYDFNEYVGLEARAIRTNWKSNGGKIKHAGLFVKPMYPVSEDINVYGLAGYAKTTTQASKRRTDTEALAWGIGLEYDFGSDTPKEGKYARTFDGYGDQESGFGLFVDYERLVQKSGSPDLDTVNVGITYDF